MDSPRFYGADWSYVAWLVSATRLPVIVKGIMQQADGDEAIRTGVRGIYVSKRGGHSLDTLPATIEVLPAVMPTVRNSARPVEVYTDGGYRTGLDVIKAFAYGVNAVSSGDRSPSGVEQTERLVLDDLAVVQSLVGAPQLSQVDRSLVEHELNGY